jgi:iron complex outermembrane recepter protein
LAMRFQPVSQLVLRAAFSTGFRAPSLAQSFYGSRITNFRLDPVTGKQAPFEVGIFSVESEVAQALGAKPLKPETSLNYSAGFAWSPTDQFNFTFDGYLIDLNDRILLSGFIGGDSVEKILAARNLPLTSAQYFTNIIDTRTKGVDLTANYRMLALGGALSWTLGANFTTNRIADERPLPSQLEGTGADLVDKFATIQIEKERPDGRGTLTANYTRGQADLLARGSYYGKFHSAPGLCDTCDQEFGAKTLFDLEAGYRFRGARWALGARNVFDKFPDKNTLDNGYGIFPWAGASPFGYNGRFVYARAEMVFGR